MLKNRKAINGPMPWPRPAGWPTCTGRYWVCSSDRLDWIDAQTETLNGSLAQSMRQHRDAVHRLAQVPGLGPDSAQQIVAEVGPCAATFPPAPQLAAWVGTAPGREESAGVPKSNRSPRGNRTMRRLLNQAANAAVRTKGSFF